ncbi:unnamed protein product, partial [Cuscuta epithymum]
MELLRPSSVSNRRPPSSSTTPASRDNNFQAGSFLGDSSRVLPARPTASLQYRSRGCNPPSRALQAFHRVRAFLGPFHHLSSVNYVSMQVILLFSVHPAL